MTATNIVASKYLATEKSARPSARPESAHSLPASPKPSATGDSTGLLQDSRRRCHLPRRTRSHSRPPVRRLQTRPSGSTLAATASSQLRRPQLAWNPQNPASRVRRHRLQQSTMLGVFYKLGKDSLDSHSHSRQDRRHALQVGQRHPGPISLRCAPPPKVSAEEAPPAVRSAS